MSDTIAPLGVPDGTTVEFNPSARSSYRRFQPITLRYQDLDPLGHVTSISFLACFESARVDFIGASGRPVDDPVFGWMLVKLDTDYLGQLHYPGTIDVGTRLVRVGRSSITTIQGLFDGDRCCATLRSVLVYVERAVDRSAEIPPDLRAGLWHADGFDEHRGEAQ